MVLSKIRGTQVCPQCKCGGEFNFERKIFVTLRSMLDDKNPVRQDQIKEAEHYCCVRCGYAIGMDNKLMNQINAKYKAGLNKVQDELKEVVIPTRVYNKKETTEK